MNQCAEIKLRAERRAGELLEDQKAPQGRPNAKTSHAVTFYKDIGIDRRQSHRWQQIASLNDSTFDDYIEQAKVDGGWFPAGSG